MTNTATKVSRKPAVRAARKPATMALKAAIEAAKVTKVPAGKRGTTEAKLNEAIRMGTKAKTTKIAKKAAKPRAARTTKPKVTKAKTKQTRISAEFDAKKAMETEAETNEDAPKPRQMKDVLGAARQRWGKATCGDWLADQLEQFRTVTGFDYNSFVEFLLANDVPTGGKWFTNAQLGIAGKGGHGWQGQLRMNGRIQLEKVALVRGTVVQLNGEVVKLPEEAIEQLTKKHPKLVK